MTPVQEKADLLRATAIHPETGILPTAPISRTVPGIMASDAARSTAGRAAQRAETVQEMPAGRAAHQTEMVRGAPASGALRTNRTLQTLPEGQPPGILPGVQPGLPRRGALHSRGHMRNPAPLIQIQTGTEIIPPPGEDLLKGLLAETYPEELPALYI